MTPKFIQLVIIQTSSSLLLLTWLVPALLADGLELRFLLGVEQSVLLGDVITVVNLDAGEGLITKRYPTTSTSFTSTVFLTRSDLGYIVITLGWSVLGDVVLVKVAATFVVFTESRTCHNLDLHRVQILSLNASQEVTDLGDKISTSLVECERVKAKIGKALHADGSPCVWKKFPPARGQKGFLS